MESGRWKVEDGKPSKFASEPMLTIIWPCGRWNTLWKMEYPWCCSQVTAKIQQKTKDGILNNQAEDGISNQMEDGNPAKKGYQNIRRRMEYSKLCGRWNKSKPVKDGRWNRWKMEYLNSVFECLKMLGFHVLKSTKFCKNKYHQTIRDTKTSKKNQSQLS